METTVRHNTNKELNLKFLGFGLSDKTPNWISDILSPRYELIFTDNPDFIVCSVYDGYSYTKYDCPRIFYCGEVLTPDFTLVDYAISHDRMNFEDRHFCYPSCIHNHKYTRDRTGKTKPRNISPGDMELLKSKEYFCNFIYSNQVGDCRIRDEFFHKLSSNYKPVISAGRHLNNMPDGRCLPPNGKIDFQEKCKFSIAFENQRYSGYCTEKLIDAFHAKTIPIYWGDPYVKEIFNPKAFINVPDYESWDDVIEEVRRLDNDDEAYMEMLAEPVFNDPELPARRYRELCEFLYNIFDQTPEQAYRRSRVMYSKQHNDTMKDLSIVKSNKVGNKLYSTAVAYAKEGLRGVLKKLKNRLAGSSDSRQK